MVSLNELHITDAQANAILASARSFNRDVELARVEGELSTFETLFGISTDEMRKRVLGGTLEETGEICAWLMVHNRQRDLLAR